MDLYELAHLHQNYPTAKVVKRLEIKQLSKEHNHLQTHTQIETEEQCSAASVGCIKANSIHLFFLN